MKTTIIWLMCAGLATSAFAQQPEPIDTAAISKIKDEAFKPTAHELPEP